MKAQISLVTIWTDNITRMKEFYQQTLGFGVELDLGEYVEFTNEGVRFAICTRKIMHNYSEEFKVVPGGQIVELAFPCESPADVDVSYNQLVAKGATPVQSPQDMPWNQRAAFFADPDGNIHELFAELK